MRKLILMLALASAATPVLAEPREGWADRRAARAEQRQERAAEAPRSEAPREMRVRGEGRGFWQRSEAASVERAPQAERGMRGGWGGGFVRDGNARAAVQSPDPGQVARWRERQEQARAQRASEGSVPATRWSDHVRQSPYGGWTRPTMQGQTAPVVRYRDRTRDQRQWTGDQRQWSRDQRQWNGDRTSGQWQGTRHVRHWDGNRDGQRWSNNWRRDSRYDWRRYRDRNRSIFRVGHYYDPFGWGYRPLSIGFTLYSGYYQPSYWLDDPWQYRLPPVYGPYRWVRYYDDAVLVDIYSGQVVDVIRNFFW